jgi:hypothetical protein
MRKMITLIAAAALVASPFAFAEDQTTGNPNDVLQTVPGQMADSGTPPAAPTEAGDATPPSGGDAAAEPAKKPVHHHKHHVHHYHHHHHHHHHHTVTAPSTDTHTTKEEANSPSGNDMSAPAAH